MITVLAILNASLGVYLITTPLAGIGVVCLVAGVYGWIRR